MKTTEIDTACPCCKERVDAHTSAFGDHDPKPGDVSVCAYCNTLAVFDDALRLRHATDDELAALKRSGVLAQVAKVQSVMVNRPWRDK